MNTPNLVSPDLIRQRFSRAMSDMYREEVPLYGALMELVAQTNANPTFGGETMARYYDPAIRRLIELIKRVLPEAREVDLYWAYHNLSGALTLTLGETGRLDRLSNGRARSGDLETAGDYMVRFAAAGFRAVVGMSLRQA